MAAYAVGGLALAWLLGIAAAAFAGTQPAVTIAAVGLLGAASFAVLPRPGAFLIVAAGAVLIAVAGAHYDATEPKPSPVSRLNGEDVTLRAAISREPVERTTTRVYRLEVREVFENERWRPESGSVLMTGFAFPRYEYGDLIEVEGKLEAPPVLDDFNYRDYLLRQGISSVIAFPSSQRIGGGEGNLFRSAQIRVRTALSNGIAEALPEPEASLAAGILLGVRSSLPPDLRDDMNDTGTSHLTAVSGQNVVLIAGFVIAMLAWAIGRRPAAWVALVALIAYSLVVGLQPSVFRAMIMGAIYVSATIAGRQNTAWYALVIAAAVMTAFEPHVVRDVSFQLSFAASLGLVTLAGPLREDVEAVMHRFLPDGVPRILAPITEVATVTSAAILFTLPIMAINFERISLVAPVANLFAVPAFVALAFTAAISGAVGSIPGVDAGFMVWFAWPAAAYMTAVVGIFAAIPHATVGYPFASTPAAFAYYAFLAIGVWQVRSGNLQRKERQESPPINWRVLQPAAAGALIIALASALLWLAATAPPSGRLSVTFLDVGQGDAALIEGPAGHRILVDGGPSGAALKRALNRHLPFYDRRIDLAVLTHPDADHAGGLPSLLESYRVGGVMTAGTHADTAVYAELRDAIHREGVAEVTARRGHWIDLGDGARLTVLGPVTPAHATTASPNDASIVLRLSHGGLSLLLTGDITADAEEALLRAGTDVTSDVLHVPHHGSRTSTTEPFLARTRTHLGVISVGESNRFGHPAPEVLDRLAGHLILRTDLHGDITIQTDGHRLWFRTQHNPPPTDN